MRMILLFMLFFFPACLVAQTAEKYFHNSAKLYIDDKKEQALSMLDEGIKKYPNDSSLIKLRGRIELPPPPPPKQQEQQKEQEQQEQQKQQQSQKNLSKEDAEKLLRALMEQEKKVQQDINNKKIPAEKVPPEKDW